MKIRMLFYFRVSFCVCFIFLLACQNETRVPPKGFFQSEEFVDKLIQQMTLEQKVALLHGMGGGNSEFGDLDIQFFGINGNPQLGIPPLYMGTVLPEYVLGGISIYTLLISTLQ